MKNLIKSLVVTGLTLCPVAIRHYCEEYTIPFWPTFGVFAIAVFGGYWKFVFKPDSRFLTVRSPTLDNFFEQTFSQFEPPPGGRLPFRVYVYQPVYLLWAILWWPFVWLKVAYSWKSNPTDADHGKMWWCWRGLVGKVYRTGLVEFYRKGDDLAEYNMRDSDVRQTEAVCGIFCYPLRRPAKTEKERVSSKITAIVSIDAITESGAEQLEAWWEEYKAGGLNIFVDKASWLSLYF